MAAPVVDTAGADPETAYWRNQYKQNRMVPPRDFQVPPKPMPDNQFGEFRDEYFAGLDAQPGLPDLPGDPAGVAAGTFAPRRPFPAPPVPGERFAARRGGAAAPPGTAPSILGAPVPAVEPAGIEAEARFYPVEQLVYGGEYPDMNDGQTYRLMPKDEISVTVKDHPEFSGKVTIQPDGTVRIPNTPDVIRLRGLDADGAAEAVRRHLTPYVRGECLVRVQTNRARGGYYFVFGDVLQPGRFPMGMELVRLSDAVLAANWEANPARLDADGDELGPAFPAAAPRGKFIAPRSADLAQVQLITPHRSQPARTVHDVRSAMVGVTGNDPVVRPGQIIVVPSLDPERNRSLGLEQPKPGQPPESVSAGAGFSGSMTPARLPEILPGAMPPRAAPPPVRQRVEDNLAAAFDAQSNTGPLDVESAGDYCQPIHGEAQTYPAATVAGGTSGWTGGPVGRRLGRKIPEKGQFSTQGSQSWSKGL